MIDVIDICQRYLNGESIQEIADSLDRAPVLIRGVLGCNNIELRTHSEQLRIMYARRRRLTNLNIQKIITLYTTENLSLISIAKRFGYKTEAAIRKILKEHNIQTREQVKYSKLPINEIIRLYTKEKKTSQEIANIFQVSAFLILKCLHKSKIKLRTRSENKTMDWNKGGLLQRKER